MPNVHTGGVIMKKIVIINAAILIVSLSLSFLFISIPAAGFLLLSAAGVFAVYSVHRYYQKLIHKSEASVCSMEKRMGSYNYEVQVSASQIASVSEQLGLMFSENNVYASDLFEQTAEMTSLNKKVAADIRGVVEAEGQLMVMIEESVVNADAMQEIGKKSNETVGRSLDSIFEIVNTIGEIRKSSDNTVLYMARLEKTSNEIATILESVEDISQQTHLLALNAAIESARAGNAGRGFAVVADEIGKLSINTSNAVKNVSTLISGIQEEILGVSTMVKENTVNVTKGVIASKNVETNLVSIRQSFEDVLSKVSGIRDISIIEKSFGSDIERRAEDVSQMIRDAEKSVQSVSDAVSRQKDHMRDLSEMSTRLVGSSSALTNLFDSSSFSGTKYLTPELEKKIQRAFEIMKSAVLSKKEIQSKEPQLHEGILKELLLKHDFIEAAWSNDEKGRFIVSIPPAGIANANVRDWFRESVSGKEYVSGVYISAITKSPCITVSKPITAPAGGIIGVLGLDIRLV
jgi:methyl-accepting chemotaxis protein